MRKKKIWKNWKTYAIITIIIIVIILLLKGCGSQTSILNILNGTSGESRLGGGGDHGFNSEAGSERGILMEVLEDLRIISDSRYDYNETCLENNEREAITCYDECGRSSTDCRDDCTTITPDDCDEYDGCLAFCDGVFEEEELSSEIIDFLFIIPSAYAFIDIDGCYEMCEEDHPECSDDLDEECYDECMIENDCDFEPDEEERIFNVCGGACIDYTYYGYGDSIMCMADCVGFYGMAMGYGNMCDFEWIEANLDCRLESAYESFVWDNSPVVDVNIFYETNYPLFYMESVDTCTNWMHNGNWIETSEKVGCVDFDSFDTEFCESPSMVSAMDVCETIGGTFTCEEEDITCNLEVPE